MSVGTVSELVERIERAVGDDAELERLERQVAAAELDEYDGQHLAKRVGQYRGDLQRQRAACRCELLDALE